MEERGASSFRELSSKSRNLLKWMMVVNSVLLLILLVILAGMMVEVRGREGSTVEESAARQWAVLVAGSRGWDNYRHQADVCHAFHLLRSRGIPEANIVVSPSSSSSQSY